MLLTRPRGRWLSRHLFGLFVSSEKRTVFFLGLIRGGFFSLRVSRFHIELKLSSHIVMQLDRDLVFAGVLDRSLEHQLVSIDIQAELVLHSIHDVLSGNRTERFARFAGCERKRQARFADLASEFLGFI